MQHNIATKVLNLSFLQERARAKVRENQILSFFLPIWVSLVSNSKQISMPISKASFFFNLVKHLSTHTTDFVSSLPSYFLLHIIKIGSMVLLADDKPNM